MSVLRSEQEFARRLGQFEGQDFEDEVCVFLRRCVSDFQDIPAKPQGDAGLDGLSHGQTVAYCCYGPEQEPSKVKAKGLKADIIKKFRSDLRALFEISVTGKGRNQRLAHCPTNEMSTILASGSKITLVRLIVSVFDTHQILGPLNESFEEYRAASQNRYVDKKAALTIWGPKQLAGIGAVDDLTLLRLEQREILRRVAVVVNSTPAPQLPPTSEFEAKFDWIESRGKVSSEVVTRLRNHFRKRWSIAIALENDFANNAVGLHQSLSRAREHLAVDADLASGMATNPMELIERMRQKVTDRLNDQLGIEILPDTRTQIVDGELARLIGECPIDWRS